MHGMPVAAVISGSRPDRVTASGANRGIPRRDVSGPRGLAAVFVPLSTPTRRLRIAAAGQCSPLLLLIERAVSTG
jgi:hypothetical protein